MYLRIAINSLLMCANIISVQISFLWGQLWKDCVLKGTSPSQGIEICLWSMIQMNLVVFSCVWADRAVLGSTETAKQKLKYGTFEGDFFMFLWAKE